MNLNKLEFRIRYAHTDHFGVVYYARYLDWLEAGRTEILRQNGVCYKDCEDQGFFAPVVKLEIEYKAPARYDDIIVVDTKIEQIGTSSVHFTYSIYNKKTNQLLANAKTINVFIKKDGTKIDVPAEIRKILDE